MTSLTRREFLAAAGAVGAVTALGACDTGTGGSSGDDALTWWDHTPNLQQANQRIFKQFEEKTGTRVDYTYHLTAKLGQALQLAKQSDQLPDVFTNVGLKLPAPALIKGGWFQPVEFSDEAIGRLPANTLIDGIHVFDGKVYSLPVFNDRQYWAATWFNTEMLSAAEVEPPSTYDDFRAAAKAVKESTGDETYGWIFNLGQPERLAEVVNFLAQGAGFEGFSGQLYRTGEIAYDDDAYLTVFEFLLSLQEDGLLFPGSQSLDDKAGRVRWAAGAAGFFFDGPWCAGTLSQDAPEFLEKLDVAPMIVPEAGQDPVAYRGPQGGMYWVSGASERVDKASELLGYQTQEQFYIDIANGMAQPPLDLAAIEKADVHPAWKKLVGWYQDTVFQAPVAVVQNGDIEKVNAEAEQVEPDLGTIIQGAFSGDVPDVQKALKELTDKSTQDRERSIAEAKKKGAKVELDDWAFPNWQPGKDFTKDMYRS